MADEALLELFNRKMNKVSADDQASIADLSEFYSFNEAKLIAVCKRHIKEKKYKRMKDFVEFEYKLRYTPTEPEAPPKMTLAAEGTGGETKGNPDGLLVPVSAD